MDVPPLYIHLSVNKYLKCFNILAIVNNATINICVQVFCVDTHFHFLVYIPRSGTTES